MERRTVVLRAAGVAVLLSPVAWALWHDPAGEERPPADTRGPLPRKDPTRVLRREPLDSTRRLEGEDILSRFRSKWRLNHEERLRREKLQIFGCGWREPGLFRAAWGWGSTEVRLFALGYPELAEGWAQGIVEGLSETPWETPYAFVALSALMREHWGAVESVLLRLTSHPEGRHAPLEILTKNDSTGVHRKLYQTLARAGESWAILALSRWGDPESMNILKEGLERWRSTPDVIHPQEWVSRMSLRLAQAIDSRRSIDVAREVITRESDKWFELEWALHVRATTPGGWFEPTLLERLETLRRTNRAPPTESDEYDELLLALAQLGGTMTPVERAYLRRYGYACDPRERLAEILREKDYPDGEARPRPR